MGTVMKIIEQPYLDLVRDVLEHGERRTNRTGVDTLALFGAHYSVDLADGFPLLTTKRVNWDAVRHELVWYLSGQDHIRELRKKTKIWDAWADEDGHVDSPYGWFWRCWPVGTEGRGLDQVQMVLQTLRGDPDSRRMVVTAWEPVNAWGSRIPPCHYSWVVSTIGGRLNLHLSQRSADIAIGVPFNLAAYAALAHLLASHAGLPVGVFSHTLVDAHVYVNHVDGLWEQLGREPRSAPRLEVPDLGGLFESGRYPFDEVSFDDMRLVGYDPHPSIKFEVAV